jgi:hypothetical protein
MSVDKNNPTTWPEEIHFTATGMIMVDHLTRSITEEWNDASPRDRREMWDQYKALVFEEIEEQIFQGDYKLVLTDDAEAVLQIGIGSGND